MTAATTQTIHFNPAHVASTSDYDPDDYRRPRRWLRKLFAPVVPCFCGVRPRRAKVQRRKAWA